jgi:hypothetical protein
VEREGVVAPDDADAVAVGLTDAGERGLDAAAERALVVREHRDRDERVVGAALRHRVGDRNAEPIDVVVDRRPGADAVAVLADRGDLVIGASATASRDVADEETADERDEGQDDRRGDAHGAALLGRRVVRSTSIRHCLAPSRWHLELPRGAGKEPGT